MNLGKKWAALARLVSKDKDKRNLGHIKLDLTRGRAIATDGHLMLDLPLPERSPAGGSFYALPHQAAWLSKGRGEVVAAFTEGGGVSLAGGAAVVDLARDAEPFPDTDRVFSAMGAPEPGACAYVDASLLARLTAAVDATALSTGKTPARGMWLGIVHRHGLSSLVVHFEAADAKGGARGALMGRQAPTPPEGWKLTAEAPEGAEVKA